MLQLPERRSLEDKSLSSLKRSLGLFSLSEVSIILPRDPLLAPGRFLPGVSLGRLFRALRAHAVRSPHQDSNPPCGARFAKHISGQGRPDSSGGPCTAVQLPRVRAGSRPRALARCPSGEMASRLLTCSGHAGCQRPA